MSSSIVRRGGWAGVAAAVVYMLAGTLILTAPPQGVFSSFSDYLSEISLIMAFAVTLVVIAGLHGLQRGRYGRLGAVGSLVAFIGYALIVLVAAVTVLVGDEALFAVRLIAALAVLIGSVLLGAMTLRARVLPWWCGVVLIVGFPLGDITDEIVARGSEGIVVRYSLEVSGLRALVEQSYTGPPIRSSELSSVLSKGKRFGKG